MIDRYNDKENNPNNSSINRKTKKIHLKEKVNHLQKLVKILLYLERNKKTTFRSSKPIL